MGSGDNSRGALRTDMYLTSFIELWDRLTCYYE